MEWVAIYQRYQHAAKFIRPLEYQMPARRCVYLMDPVNLATQHRSSLLSLLACLRAILRAFQIENGPSSTRSLSSRRGALIVIFIIFQRLNFSIALSAAHFTDASMRRECLASPDKESAHFFLLTWSSGEFRSLFSCLSYVWFHIWMLYYDGSTDPSIYDAFLFTTWFFKCELPCACSYFLKGDLTWYIYEWQLIIYMADY